MISPHTRGAVHNIISLLRGESYQKNYGLICMQLKELPRVREDVTICMTVPSSIFKETVIKYQ